MGSIFCIVGKSSSGKDTIYKMLMQNNSLRMKRIVPYTTRPIRVGEQEGVEYYFTTVEAMEQLKKQNKIVECRSYDTIYGPWYYFMAKDNQIDLELNDYLIIGTLESYTKIRDYFGRDRVVPIYIELDDGERLSRALEREKRQSQPMYEEMCRRFIADARDFSQENLENAGITIKFDNYDLTSCLNEVAAYIIAEQNRELGKEGT
ncbi:MAG: guanylate kinase [Lachnospiraceae bacterium]|nr:guanylate kinase [Lachnospiraceae bacterium]MDE7271584.1 guanylate kinase [Lachnospiraceae bacterium]